MRVVDQTYEPEFPVEALERYPGNPRRGNVELIGQSIDVNGFFGAVLVEEGTGRILAGNHTYMAALEQGAETIPAILVNVDDEEHGRRILAVANAAADRAVNDPEALSAFLHTLSDLAGSGYGEDELSDLDRLLAVPTPTSELSGRHGEVDDAVFYPEIHVKVPPEVFDRWRDALDHHHGKNDAAKLVGLLTEVETGRAAKVG